MTQMLSATDLAKALNVSKARVSQWTTDGDLLKGCFSGTGRARRYDLARVASALGRTLDQGQMMGNGAATRRAIQALADDDDDGPGDAAPAQRIRPDSELPRGDLARYEMARTQKAEEEARRLRRTNAEAEGTFVLASEVSRVAAKAMAQEVAEFDGVLRDAARKAADLLGVDFKVLRKILQDHWRAHRAGRTQQLGAAAEAAGLSETERAEDI
jgi:transcriptional regulator with XRE-family HTH domain